MLKSFVKISSIAALLTPLVNPHGAIAMPNDPGLYCYQVLPSGQVVNLGGMCSSSPETRPATKPQAKPIVKPEVKPQATTRSGIEPYPPFVAQNFINTCAKTAPRSICTCAFKKIENRYSLAEFIQIAGTVQSSRQLPSEMLSMVSSCVGANR
jgi:hypothetical protein